MEEYKNQVINRRRRLDDLKKIRDERKFIFNLSNVFQKEVLENQHSLTHKQYIIINIALQANIQYVRYLFDIVILHGPIQTFFTVFVGLLLLGLPLFGLFSFLGFYSKKGFIQVWDCVPIMKGIGLSMSVILILNEIYHIIIGIVSMKMIYDVIAYKALPWTHCLPETSSTGCIRKGKTFNATCTVDDDSSVFQYYSVQDYMRETIFSVNKNTSGLNPTYLFVGSIMWAIVWFLSYQGYPKFAKYSVYVNIFLCILLVPVSFLLVFKGSQHMELRDRITKNKVQDKLTIFGTAISLSLYGNEPGTIIFTSALAPPKMMIGSTTFYIYTCKVLLTFWFVIWYIIVLQTLMNSYKIPSTACVRHVPHDILISGTLDMLMEVAGSKLWCFLWLSLIFFNCTVSVLYSVTAVVDSMLEFVPAKMRKRNYVCMFTCLFGFLMSSTYFNNNGISDETIMQSVCLRICTLFTVLIATVTMAFCYSVGKVANDMFFLYKVRVSRMWTTAWIISPLVLFIGFAMLLQQTEFVKEMNKIKYMGLQMIPIFQYIFILGPIIINALIVYTRYIRSEKQTYVIRPTKKWGPKGVMLKTARLQFRPHRDIRYRSPMLRCKHACLVNTTHYEHEKTMQSVKYKNFVDELFGENAQTLV